jgi:hypothetical protein
MPSFVITNSGHKPDQPIDAILAAPNANGYPDRRSDISIRAIISDKTIKIDNEPRPRRIISTVGQNGITTYLIDGNAKQIRNREARVALTKALSQLNELTKTLRPLISASDYKLANEALGELYNWIRDENERLTEDGA